MLAMRLPGNCVSIAPTPSDFLEMPLRKRKARDAKQRRQEGHKQGRVGFAPHVVRRPSPNASDYRPSTTDDDVDESESASESEGSSNNRGRKSKGTMSVVALQRLYAVFLPHHLQLNQETRSKRRKGKARRAIYTKESRSTKWRRKVKQERAAQGCTTLDGFVLRKVCDTQVEKNPTA
jgi:hypothetical protein